MTTFAQTAGIIRKRFTTFFPTLQPTVSYTFENMAFETPNPDPSSALATSWVRGVIREGFGFQASLGLTRRWRNSGIAIFQIFTPAAVGEGVAESIAVSISSIYRGVSDTGVVFGGLQGAPEVSRVGVTEDGAWYQINVRCPFYSDLTA